MTDEERARRLMRRDPLIWKERLNILQRIRSCWEWERARADCAEAIIRTQAADEGELRMTDEQMLARELKAAAAKFNELAEAAAVAGLTVRASLLEFNQLARPLWPKLQVEVSKPL